MFFYFYGFFIALGILAGIWAVEKFKYFLKSEIINHISVYSFLPWGIIPGIIGARIYHVINFYNYYSQNPIEVFYLWQGGLGIYGGIIGGIIGLYLYSIKTVLRSTDSKFFSSVAYSKKVALNHKINGEILTTKKENFEQSPRTVFGLINKYFLQLLDLAVIGLPLGQAIGRIGNYFNQELYGLPTNLPWGTYINLENRLPGYEQFSKFHPLFLYESLGSLVIFIILVCLIQQQNLTRFSNRVRKIFGKLSLSLMAQHCKHENSLKFVVFIHKPGTIFFVYLFLYSFLRFWLEFLRIDSWMAGEIRVNQLVALLCVLISTIYLLYKKRFFSVE